MRLYIDEDTMSRALVQAARRQGFDVLTSREAGMDGTADVDQLEFATRDQRVLVTTNRHDYARISASWHRAGRSHSGLVILTRQDLEIGVILRGLESIRGRGGSTVDVVAFI